MSGPLLIVNLVEYARTRDVGQLLAHYSIGSSTFKDPLKMHKRYSSTHWPRFLFRSTRTALRHAQDDFSRICGVAAHATDGKFSRADTRLIAGQSYVSLPDNPRRISMIEDDWTYLELPKGELALFAYLRVEIPRNLGKSTAFLDIFMEGNAISAGKVFHDISKAIRSVDCLLLPGHTSPDFHARTNVVFEPGNASKQIWTPRGYQYFAPYNPSDNPFLKKEVVR